MRIDVADLLSRIPKDAEIILVVAEHHSYDEQERCIWHVEALIKFPNHRSDEESNHQEEHAERLTG